MCELLINPARARGSWVPPLLLVLITFWIPRQGMTQVLLNNFEHEDVKLLALSPDDKTLALVQGKREDTHFLDVEVYDVSDIKAPKRRIVATKHKEWLDALTFSPDGRLLATLGFDDPVVKLWDPATGKEKAVLKMAVPAQVMAFSPDGKVLAVSAWEFLVENRSEVKLFDTTTGKELASLPGLDKKVERNYQLVFSPDGTTLAMSSACNRITNKVAEVRLWDMATRRMRYVLRSSVGDMIVLFSPDSKLLATRSDDPDKGTAELKLWNVATGREKVSLVAGRNLPINGIAFSPDGRTLATGMGLLAAHSPEARKALERADEDRLLSLKNSSGLKLWEVATGKERANLDGHQDPVYPVAFSPDGRLLASAERDQYEERGEIRFWNLRTAGKKWVRLPEQTNVGYIAFWRHGGTLVTVSDTAVKLWDVSDLLKKAQPKPAHLSSAELDALWTDLADEDAAKAYRAIQTLIQTDKQAGRFLSDRLKPARPADPKHLARMIADLDSKEFAVREKAESELGQLGEFAEPALRRAVQGQPSLELRRRVESLLQRVEGPVTSQETLRELRAIEVLEHLGTSEARQVLERLTNGTPEARLTQAAKDALGRLAKRSAPTP